MSSSREQSLEALIAGLPVAAFLLQDGRIAGLNQAAAGRVGQTAQQSLAGQELMSWVAAADQAALGSALLRSADYPVVVTLQLLCVGGDSTLTELTLISGWGGNPQLTLALAASPVAAPGALGHDWRFLRQVIDACPNMIFVKDRQGRFLLANRALAKAYDLTVAEVEGQLNAALHSNPEEIEAFLLADREVMDSRQERLIIAEPVTYADGSLHWYTTGKTPLLLDDIHCDHILGIATNIDELKIIEEELLQLQDSLEQRVEARTRELNAKEMQLREALALNQSILMTSVAGILAYRADGQCVLANPAAAALIGGSQEQLLAQNFHHLASWQQSGLYAAACRALAAEAPVAQEVHLVSTFGRELWMDAQFARFTLHGEAHLILAMHDITEMRRATKALAERELAFRSLADNVPDNVVRYDLEGRVLFLNRKVEFTLGCTADQLIGKTLVEFGDPEMIERYGALLETVIGVGASGVPATIEQQVPGPDGEIQYHLIRIVAESGPDGRPQSVLAVGRDITAEKIADEELLLAASVFHNTAEGVLITDAEGTILSVNPAFSAITGFSEMEALGQTPRMLRSEHQDGEFYQTMWRTLLNDGHWEGEIWNRRRNGEAFLEWLTINRIDDPSGKTVRYVSVFHDITEMHNKDEHIRHLAFHDALTGLPNRILMQDRLQHAVNRCRREQRRLSVTFIDLDR
ncbi:MAG TPA: PAS domain S-box protein, partial [Azonexus sp.]|nr:PAS domain S-box protein [Azonexus sp.]